jgi:hypothetical protein
MREITTCVFFLAVLLAPISSAARNDWQSELHRWAVSSQTDPNCKVRYATGVYRPDLGDKPVWGFMTERMFKYFSRDGAKLAPSICPVTLATVDKAAYRLLFSVSPMKTVSQTTHGSETQTTTEPFNASVAYSDGSTATIQGQQTTTVVVPTETTISRSSVALYMYTYRVKGDQMELIGTDDVVFSRVAASGSGTNAAGAELGAGIGNIVRASKDRHRADKLFEEALKAIMGTEIQPLPAAQPTPALSTNHEATDVPARRAEQSSAAQVQLQISSTPGAADIEIDGSFVGNTPSTVGVAPGQHQLSVKKTGFKPWERKMTVSSGQVNVNAELEPEPK